MEPKRDDQPTENYFAQLSREFAKSLWTLQSCAFFSRNRIWRMIAAAFSSNQTATISPGTVRRYELDYDDIAWVLPIVTYWCRLNGVELTITFSEESYV